MGNLTRSAAAVAAAVLLASVSACSSGPGAPPNSSQLVHPGAVVLHGESSEEGGALVSDSTAVSVRAGEFVAGSDALTIGGNEDITVKSVEPIKSIGLTSFQTVSKSAHQPGYSLFAVGAELPSNWSTGASSYPPGGSVSVGVAAEVMPNPAKDWVGAIQGLRITYEVGGTTHTVESKTQFCWAAQEGACCTTFPLT